MRAWLTALALSFSMLGAQPSLAVDGDFIPFAPGGTSDVNPGPDEMFLEWLLCDGAIGACATFDFQNALNGPGVIPDRYVIEMRAEDCVTTEPTFTIQGHATSGGIAHVYSTTLGTAGGNATSIEVNPGRHRFLSGTNTAGSGGCTDVEVVIRAFYRY
jgi:hypothetical protein